MNKHKGFTLLELAITISIIIIITVAILPNFFGFSKRQAVIQASEKLKSDFELVQNKSLSGVVTSSGDRVDWGISFGANCNSSYVSSYNVGYFDLSNNFISTNTQDFTGIKINCQSGTNSIRFERLTGSVTNAGSGVVFYIGLSTEAGYLKSVSLGSRGQVIIGDISQPTNE